MRKDNFVQSLFYTIESDQNFKELHQNNVSLRIDHKDTLKGNYILEFSWEHLYQYI